MSAVERIAKNTLVLISGEIIGKILALIFTIYAARYLHAEGFGVLSFALAFTGMFGIFADIGFYELIVREVARDKRLVEKYLGNVALIKTIMVTVIFGIMCLTINLMGYPFQTILVVYIVGLAVVLDTFCILFNAIFQAFEKMEYISIGKIIRNSLLLIGAFVAVLNKLDILAFATLYLLANSALLCYNVTIALKRFARPKFDIDIEFWKWLIKEGVFFWASGVFVVIINQIDQVMLSFMVGDAAVGLYSAAYRIVFTLNFIPMMFISAIYPVTSRLYLSSRDSLREVVERSFKYLLITGLVMVVLLTSFGDYIIFHIFGEEYLPSVACLKILVWAELFVFLNVCYGNLFKSTNRQIFVMYQTMFATFLNVILNLILIPKLSYTGASYATLATRFFSFIFYSAIVMKSEYSFSGKLINDFTKIVVLTAMVWVPLLFAGFDRAFALVYSLIFPLILLYLGVIDDVDRKIAKDIFSLIRRWK